MVHGQSYPADRLASEGVARQCGVKSVKLVFNEIMVIREGRLRVSLLKRLKGAGLSQYSIR